MTTDQLIHEFVWLSGQRTLVVRWSDSSFESHTLRSDPPQVFGVGYGHILRLAELLNGLLTSKPIPVLIMHEPHLVAGSADAPAALHNPKLVYQVEARKGKWRNVSPARVRKAFQLASVPGIFEFKRLLS
jgi:hypothetical protein